MIIEEQFKDLKDFASIKNLEIFAILQRIWQEDVITEVLYKNDLNRTSFLYD
jgi:hypothetical protein